MAKRVCTVCLLLVLTPIVGHAQENENVSAKGVLDRMFSVYRSCKSYVDKGEAKEIWGSGNRVVRKPFTTAFVRPSLFRFEFTEDSDLTTQTLVVWRDGVSIRSWWSVKPETKYYETLGPALRDATGVSSGSAAVVPTMLLQNLGDRQRFQNLTDLKLIGNEKVGGKTTYRLEGKDWMNRKLSLWIDSKTFLLLKMIERTRTDRSDVELTIRYEPQINVDVPPGKLAFKH